ncbi:MAG: hypothetical protein F6K65_18120 [Moorea sp. SIO3C2]|nr:hypothetical protein [Moorena sp. SIO3C2]
MPTNARKVGIARMNSARIWGWKPAMPTLQNATKCVRVAALLEHRTWKPAMGTLVGGHCSGEFRQDLGLETGNAHPTEWLRYQL